MPADLALLLAAVLCLIAWNAVAVAAVARRRLARLEVGRSQAPDETPAADTPTPCAATQSGETLALAFTPARSR
jgi:hypothetical protein